VALIAAPELTADGYIVSRTGRQCRVAVALAWPRPTPRADRAAAQDRDMVTITEEVSHGASHGLDPDVPNRFSVDNAVLPRASIISRRGDHPDGRSALPVDTT
jgi:hypothetical protein